MPNCVSGLARQALSLKSPASSFRKTSPLVKRVARAFRHVGAFTSVSFTITTVPGIKNMIFGGDGIFLAQLVGPGTVWLQTLPISRLAHQIAHYMPGDRRNVLSAGRSRPARRHCGLHSQRGE